MTTIFLWVYFLMLILSSILAGCCLSKYFPTKKAAIYSSISTAMGAGLGPFFLGFLSLLVLTVLPGQSHQIHLAVITALSMPFLWFGRQYLPLSGKLLHSRNYSKRYYMFTGLIILFTIALILNITRLPLTQNDPLEYGLAAKLLFETTNIINYPAIHPTIGSTGFFGPWTHPPLYTSLIYTSYLTQGHANIPILMRLIAPWCFFSAALIIYMLGLNINRFCALISTAFFMSTPLLFLGTDASSIDAMPILGITLLLASLIAFDKSTFKTPFYQGFILGLSLWTHSEAILYIPIGIGMIFFQYGFRKLPRYFLHCLIFTSIGCLIAFPAYFHNYKIFGTLISDNPEVFALPSLHWDSYFELGRGISTLTAKIQYGLFKGWFSPDAYGMVFWYFIVFLCLCIPLLRLLIKKSGLIYQNKKDWFYTLFAFVLIYITGVGVSIAIGTDLMIKNERYWLVIMPSISLLSGALIAYIFSARLNGKKISHTKTIMKSMIPLSLYFLFFCQFLVFSLFRYTSLTTHFDLVANLIHNKWEQQPQFVPVNYLKKHVPSTALVLTFRPADMYYAPQKMISFLDPRLIPIYEEKDPIIVWKKLNDLGIDYIHVPDYFIPTIYHTQIQKILVEPKFTQLLITKEGTQIYALNKVLKVNPKPESVIDLSPQNYTWYIARNIILGGRKTLLHFQSEPFPLPKSGIVNFEHTTELFQRDWSTVIMSGKKDDFVKRNSHCISVTPNQEYTLSLNLQGNALVEVYMRQYDEKNNIIHLNLPRAHNSTRVSEFDITNAQGIYEFHRRLTLLKQTHCIALSIEHLGGSTLTIKQAYLMTTKRT